MALPILWLRSICSTERDNGYLPSAEILLIAQVLVAREKDIKQPFHARR